LRKVKLFQGSEEAQGFWGEESIIEVVAAADANFFHEEQLSYFLKLPIIEIFNEQKMSNVKFYCKSVTDKYLYWLKLRLDELSRFQITLEITSPRRKQHIRWYRVINTLPTPMIESLKLPLSFMCDFSDYLFWTCRPKFLHFVGEEDRVLRVLFLSALQVHEKSKMQML
ncbi:hypothetical protein LINPERHAP1_LOCUS4421, partial [Linum perenne]